MSVLEAILSSTREEIARLRAGPTPPRADRAPIDVALRLKREAAADPLRLIAEIKKRSPSAGPLSRTLSVADRGRAYARAGATMISVLVDRAHFDGSFDDLSAARAAVAVPLLCKGFVLDEVQLDFARAAGADAVLLIVRILDDASLGALVAATRRRGMTPIVEVVDEAELDRALAVGATVVGVNARDLDTLRMDAARAARVVSAIPEGVVSLFFSGLSTPDEVAKVARAAQARRIDGALVGEALMRRDDPEPLLREMVAAARPATLPAG
jgi:indole-3-glycerol phosphate synthase